MEFKEAMRIWRRMCAVIKECDDCPMSVKGACLSSADMQDGSIMEAILAKWSAERPEKTIADDFFEKHPNAPGKQDKQPLPCAVHCGYIDKCPDDFTALECKKCWQQQLKEE